MTKSTALCPFTLKPLFVIKNEDLAVIYRSNPLISLPSTNDPSSGVDDAAEVQTFSIQCGHSCTLTHLVSYLHDSGGSSSKSCPVCQSSPASSICDTISSEYLIQNNGAETPGIDEGRVISFRYGTIFYFLWVQTSPSLPPSSYSKLFRHGKGNALSRIGSVLGMDVDNGLKVIHKGKVIYPCSAGNDESYDDISQQLLDISASDLIHRRKKPSLVIMGLRQPTNAVGNRPTSNFVYSIASRLAPRYIWNMARWGFQFTFRTTVSLVGGLFLFIRSILYPPRPTQQ